SPVHCLSAVRLASSAVDRVLRSFPTRRSSDLKCFKFVGSLHEFVHAEHTCSTLNSVDATGDVVQLFRRFSACAINAKCIPDALRSEEHTSELQSREISYAVFCLKKKKQHQACS